MHLLAKDCIFSITWINILTVTSSHLLECMDDMTEKGLII